MQSIFPKFIVLALNSDTDLLDLISHGRLFQTRDPRKLTKLALQYIEIISNVVISKISHNHSWNSWDKHALREKFNFFFQEVFTCYDKIFILGGGLSTRQ